MLPFPPVAATAAIPRPRPREFPPSFRREFLGSTRIAGELVAGFRSRRAGFYLDVAGAAFVMALFVAAAIFV
jgi:hypothetical protein